MSEELQSAKRMRFSETFQCLKLPKIGEPEACGTCSALPWTETAGDYLASGHGSFCTNRIASGRTRSQAPGACAQLVDTHGAVALLAHVVPPPRLRDRCIGLNRPEFLQNRFSIG